MVCGVISMVLRQLFIRSSRHRHREGVQSFTVEGNIADTFLVAIHFRTEFTSVAAGKEGFV